MKTAIMQPYFLPYIGYFQLINAVDTFIILDNVNLIKRGWINRNQILLNNKAYLFSIPLEKASQNKLINQTNISFSEKEREGLLKTIQLAYKKAPMFNKIYSIIENIIYFDKIDLTKFVLNSLLKITDYLDIKARFLIASEIEIDNLLKSEDKIIELCKKVNATTYINLPGGKELYNKENFKKADINIKFIEPKSENIIYKQNNNTFVASLSFLDIMMFNEKEKIKYLLKQYSLSE
jgi:hypothetical protein